MDRYGNRFCYDGNGDFKEFKRALLYDCALMRYTDEDKAKTIEYCLKGKAAKIYEQLTNQEKSDINTELC
jgi:hypothetical protein